MTPDEIRRMAVALKKARHDRDRYRDERDEVAAELGRTLRALASAQDRAADARDQNARRATKLDAALKELAKVRGQRDRLSRELDQLGGQS